MSIFNKKQIEAMFNRKYICHECGELMEFEDVYKRQAAQRATSGQNVPKSGERANAGTRRRNGAGSFFGENGKGKMEGTHERESI